MKIGITGVTGFIGTRIKQLARAHQLIGFSRHPEHPIDGCVETRLFGPGMDVSGCEALIHLAGESIMGLWTSEKRRRIRQSRVEGTRRVVASILAAPVAPRVLVSASGIGFYGDAGEQELTEDSPQGTGFLAELAHDWEAEALRAREAGVRVVLLRSGIVLGQEAGALKTMLPVFKAGLGATLGNGRQWMSWIHAEDEAALALFAVENQTISGPLNATAPGAVRNTEFTQALAQHLGRPAFLKVPAFALKLALGDFSSELLGSKRVLPQKALEAGFTFRRPQLKDAF